MSNAVVKHTGIEGLGQGMTVLGERQVRIPVGGKVRSGIMVLTATGKQHPKAQAIYDAGVAAGKRWKEIEKELIDACKFQKSPLTPKNIAYFTVRHSDFVIPESADAIMKLYGSEGPEGFHLYRFPIVFPVDAWPAILPHGLHCYTRSELVYWSEYGADGKRYCYTRAPAVVDQQSKRAIRQFGGRHIVLRSENEGLCLPEKCPEYQSKKCNLDGSFLFYIPGIPGMSAVELPTKSFYSLDSARRKLEMVAHLRGGKISGTVNGKAIFFVQKKLEEVVMLDEAGKPKKVKQWLIALEVDIDMTKVFAASELPALAHEGDKAVAALEAPAENAVDDDEELPADDEDESTPPADTLPPIDNAKAQIMTERRYVSDDLKALSIPIEKFSLYAVSKLGVDWSRTLEGLTKAKAIIQQAADDPQSMDEIKNWTGK
jgi:hypothetical protein